MAPESDEPFWEAATNSSMNTGSVSAHPLGAIQCLMLVHVGSQD